MIGKNISKIRKRQRLTLSELAEKAGISKSYLSNIERELNRNPSIRVLKKVACVLNVEVKALLIGEETKETVRLDKEWLDFVNELRESGIGKDQIQDYKKLIEFIQWQNEKDTT